jgi:thiol-disulfide isomerase/thioredoxin
MNRAGGPWRLAVWLLMAWGVGAFGADATRASFRVASLDGKSWIQPTGFAERPTVFLFWDTECAPCLEELRNIGELRNAFPEAVFVAVSLSPRTDTTRVLARYDVPADVVRALAPAEPRGLLSQLGNRAGVLPFSAAFRGSGEQCASAAGALSASFLAHAAALCTRSR